MLVDILGTSWDQCLSMVQYCFTSMETIRLVRTEHPGRPPQLSRSSWTLHRLAFFSLEMLQAGAVKGLSLTAKRTHQAWPWPEKECAEVWWLCPASVCQWSPCTNISPPGLGTMAVHLWGSHPQTWLQNKKGDDDDDCFYVALFSTLEQTHCAHMWFYMNDQLLNIIPSSPSYLSVFCCCFFVCVFLGG